MKDNKYYTPAIEEFHIGFEYEVRDEVNYAMWTVETFNEIFLPLFSVHPPTVKSEIEDNNIRVKYLDKQDIGELGFEHMGSLWFKDKLDNFRIRKWKGTEVDIYKWYPDGDGLLIFRGSIKNKSELKRVLTQIGVGYDTRN